MLLSLNISLLGATLVTRKGLYLIMLLILLIILLIAAFTIPPCLIATIKVFLKFRVLKERSYYKII
jgi:flagellar basal body-associated protein FliL